MDSYLDTPAYRAAVLHESGRTREPAFEIKVQRAGAAKAEVLKVLPYGKGTVTVVEGGLEIRNDEGTDSTLIANACAVVSLDI